AVGLEFAQAFARFGSRVTMVDALPQIAPRADAAAAAELQAALEAEGIALHLNTFVQRVEGGVATLKPRDGGAPHTVDFDRLLLASGRVPNVEELNLEAIGVETYR